MKKKIRPRDKNHLMELIESEIATHGSTCDLNHIDVSQIKTMNNLFAHLDFNGDISEWDVSRVRDMREMFLHCKFNGDISKWDVSSVQDMYAMFYKSEFNQDISQWNVSGVIGMMGMFSNSPFKHDLTNWKPLSLENVMDMFKRCKAPKPYWLKAESAEERRKLINSYVLHEELSTNLHYNTDSQKKSKI